MKLTPEDFKMLPLLAKVIVEHSTYPKTLSLQEAPSFDDLADWLAERKKAKKITHFRRMRHMSLLQEPRCMDVSRDEIKEVDVNKIGLEVLLEALCEELSQLTPREVDILKKRYCLSNADDWTFESLGAKYGISRQRVQQVERNALKKLRTALNAKFMNNYIF